MTTQRTGRTTASIEGGMISISDGWSLRGGSFSIGFAWVSGGKFSIPIGIMPGADLLSSVALVAGAPTMSQPSAAGFEAGASVAGGLFTLTGSPASAAISTPAASISGGQFSTTARNIPGGALTAGASMNAGFAGGGPSGGLFSAGATMVGGLFAATQNGAQLSSTASVVGGAPYVPYSFARVALLLPGNGTNNSTSMVDVSNNALTITRSGSPVISTAASKYGGASIRLQASTSDRLTITTASALDPGAEDFWIEGWLRWFSYPLPMFFQLNHATGIEYGQGSFVSFGWDGTSPRCTLRLYTGGNVSDSANYYSVNLNGSGYTGDAEVFNHFAAARVNGELMVWFGGLGYQNIAGTDSNGKTIGTRTVATRGSDTFIGPRVRSSGFDNYPDVYMDDFRFVKATPPWGLGNFTPSGPHPTS